MEPILEISTRITSFLWTLYEQQADASTLSTALASDWLLEMETRANEDYSRFQGLLDLAGLASESDWDLEDPLARFDRTSGPEPNRALQFFFGFWRRRRLRAERKARYPELRKAAIHEATKRIGDRVKVLKVNGVIKAVDVQEASQQAGRTRLTRDQLFEKVAAWAFGAGEPKLHAVTEVFLGQGSQRKPLFMEEALDQFARRIRPGFSEIRRGQRAAAREWLSLSRDQKLDLLLDRTSLRGCSVQLGAPVPFSMVASDELDEIARSRLIRLWGTRVDATAILQVREKAGIGTHPATPARQAFASCMFGLALSGGGIRSATFALGLMQGMADRNILPWVDILSTVSGGGYIGSWLISWIKRRGSIASVQESMRGFASSQQGSSGAPANQNPHADHMRPIRVLRDYSRYLAPHTGFFSPDNWTIATIWMRNAALNLGILLLFLGVVLLVPRLLLLGWSLALDPIRAYPSTAIAAASAPLILACFRIGWSDLSTFGSYQRPFGKMGRGDTEQWISKWLLSLIILGLAGQAAVLWTLALGGSLALEPVRLATFFAAIGFLILFGVPLARGQRWEGTAERWQGQFFGASIATGASIAACYGLLRLIYSLPTAAKLNPPHDIRIMGTLDVAIMVLATAGIFTLFIGLYGKDLSDEQREWWSRLAAWMGIAAFAWTAVCALAFFSPYWLAILSSHVKSSIAAAGGWVAVTAAGAKWAFSPHSGRNGNSSTQPWIQNLIMKIAPVIFMVGTLALVSAGLLNLMAAPVSVPLLFLGFGAVCLFLASRVDVNEFSMHHFYKNRLVRAYLGASRDRSHRYPNNFTGFDLEDDVRLRRFQSIDPSQRRDMAMDCKESYGGPFPVINTTLNVTKGADLGVQQRKAESFVFTPLWSGFDFSRRQSTIARTNLSEYAFQRAERFGSPREGGAMLGTVMAISGAAFNSNAGFHTSPSLAFLLTVLGVRLGWWAGNPRGHKWNLRSPRAGLLYLITELIANTSTERDFVLLSDGGHFENMGLYELIRRRCRYIIVSDAEEDEQFKLEGIGGAIRKCRVDFGVAIDLNLDALKPLGSPALSRFHYSVGTITYPGETKPGKLIYIKAAVTGDEPLDVIEFRTQHKEFPHTSTANQFFDESHFESYRALGHHSAQQIFTEDMPKLPLVEGTGFEALKAQFTRVEKEWAARMVLLAEKPALAPPHKDALP